MTAPIGTDTLNELLNNSVWSAWASEMFYQTGNLISGTNDVPLGMVIPYKGQLTQVRVRAVSNTRSNPLVMSIMKNNVSAGDFTLNVGVTDYTATVAIDLAANDVLALSTGDTSAGTGYVTTVSVMFAGKFALT